MKYTQLVSELGDALELAAIDSREHQEKMGYFHRLIRAEERNLHQQLETAIDKASRKKLKKELKTVKQAYSLLAA